MSLQFILGSSGSGKSYLLYQTIIKEAERCPQMNYLVLVPEQFTLQTQKDFVAMHPERGIMNIEILSFMRLANRIFQEVGFENKPILEDTGKNMILRKVTAEKKKELVLFRNNRMKQGFIAEIKSLLSEFLQYSIHPEQVEEMIKIAEGKPALSGKLQDILVIYKGFADHMAKQYVTAEELLDVLIGVIGKSELLKNSVVCLDGFTGFTPSQYQLLSHLMRICKDVYVTVTLDEREKWEKEDEEFRLFHLSKKTIHKLYHLAAEQKVPVQAPGYPEKNADGMYYRFQESRALFALEQNLFRYPVTVFEEDQEDITIHALSSPEEEAAFAVREIERMVREEGVRYRDIAIVTGDGKTYGDLLEKQLRMAGIPCFMDQKKGIVSNPLVELIRSVMELINQDFSYESVFRYLRCELVGYSAEEVDDLENYVIALGIRGYRRWQEPFTRVYRVRGRVDLDRLNRLRMLFVEEVSEIRECLKEPERTTADKVKAIYAYLLRMQAEEQIRNLYLRFEENEMPLIAKEYKQVYGLVMELFDQMVDLLGEEVLSREDFSQVLESGFDEAEVGLIPPGIDQVVVGDIERTRLKDITALLFLGVNEGIIPKAGGDGGILSDFEREVLLGGNVELAPTGRQSAYIEQFYLYLNLTKPKKRLYLVYSKVGANGKTVRPSYLIHKVRQMFPKLMVTDEEKRGDLTAKLSADKGIRYLIQGLQNNLIGETDPVFLELFAFYKKQESEAERMKALLSGVFYENNKNGIGKAVANALYGKQLTGSVTRLEQYAACAYSHFLKYGLELTERVEFKLAAPDLGNLFHNALDLFSQKLKEKGESWHSVPDSVRDAIAAECVKETADSYGNAVLFSSKRNEYMITRLTRMVKRTLWVLCSHIRQGDFEPVGFELSFTHVLKEMEQMQLQGRIDRLDTVSDENAVYVKVIDYKSGKKAFDMVSFYYGIQLQLMVYLNTAMEQTQRLNGGREVVPAGIFYYHMDDPFVDKSAVFVEEDTDSEREMRIQEEILKELRMNGIVNRNKAVCGMLDHTLLDTDGSLRPSVKSKIVPVETNKEGDFAKRSVTADTRQFEQLSAYAEGKLVELAGSMLEGNNSVNPYRMGKKTACDFCIYHGVCGFDLKLAGNAYRELISFDKEEAWEKIEREVAEWEKP